MGRRGRELYVYHDVLLFGGEGSFFYALPIYLSFFRVIELNPDLARTQTSCERVLRKLNIYLQCALSR